MAEDHELSIDAEPVVVSGARDELHRLVLNLIENAVKHTPGGTHISVSTAVDDGEAVLVVEDDGPGVPPELEERVFERFVRSGRDGARGSGLGLAIVRAVAESHGGSVTLERPPESAGARFVVRLPAGGLVSGRRRGARSDLDDDRQHHRAAPQPVVDERRQVVVELVLEQVDLPDPLPRGVLERTLDLVADIVDHAVGLLDERHAAEDHLGRRRPTRRSARRSWPRR